MDDLDKKILRILHQNARIPTTKISELVGLSRPNVTERIEKLFVKGLIDKFTIQVNLELIERKILCFIEIRNLKVVYSKIEEILLKSDYVIDVYRVTGKSNYIVYAAIPSIKLMNNFLELIMKYADADTKVILDTPIRNRIEF